jgi:hypothetical protein
MLLQAMKPLPQRSIPALPTPEARGWHPALQRNLTTAWEVVDALQHADTSESVPEWIIEASSTHAKHRGASSWRRALLREQCSLEDALSESNTMATRTAGLLLVQACHTTGSKDQSRGGRVLRVYSSKVSLHTSTAESILLNRRS